MGFLVLQIWFLDHFSIVRGGLEPSAIDDLSRQAQQVTSHPKSPRTTGSEAY